MGAVPSPAAVDAAAAAPVATAEAPARPKAIVIVVEDLARAHGVADHAVGCGAVCALDAASRQIGFNRDPQTLRVQRAAISGGVVPLCDVFLGERVRMTIG